MKFDLAKATDALLRPADNKTAKRPAVGTPQGSKFPRPANGPPPMQRKPQRHRPGK